MRVSGINLKWFRPIIWKTMLASNNPATLISSIRSANISRDCLDEVGPSRSIRPTTQLPSAPCRIKYNSSIRTDGVIRKVNSSLHWQQLLRSMHWLELDWQASTAVPNNFSCFLSDARCRLLVERTVLLLRWYEKRRVLIVFHTN